MRAMVRTTSIDVTAATRCVPMIGRLLIARSRMGITKYACSSSEIVHSWLVNGTGENPWMAVTTLLLKDK